MLGSNPFIFSSGDRLNPPLYLSNSSSGNDSRLLLLLFPEGGLLLLFLSKALNSPNRLYPIVSKCRKYPFPILPALVALFC